MAAAGVRASFRRLTGRAEADWTNCKVPVGGRRRWDGFLLQATKEREGVVKAIVPAVLLLAIAAGCDSPTGSGSGLDFEKMEVHYTRAGGWTAEVVQLDIYGTGQVDAFRISHSSADTIGSSSATLSPSERESVASMFTGFGRYAATYEPDPWTTDGDTYTIRFLYEGVADTVVVYEPEQTALPPDLDRLLAEMDAIWERTVVPGG